MVALELPGTGLSALNPKLRSAEFIKLFVQVLYRLFSKRVNNKSLDNKNTAKGKINKIKP